MNKQFKLLTAVLAVGSLLLLSGCAKYNAMTLPQLTQHSHQSEKKNLSLEHKVFDKADCKTYLGRKNILKKGFQPVQLTIANNTDHTYIYSTTSLSLPTVPSEIVAKKVKFSSLGRFLGYSAAGSIFFAPIIPIATTIACCNHPLAGLILLGCNIILGATSAGFWAIGITDGLNSHKANKELSADFADKELPFKGLLNPYQTISGIVFVPKKSFNTNFTFTLNDTDTDKAVVLSSGSNVDVK